MSDITNSYTNLEGNDYLIDRRSAGDKAYESGKNFEDQVENELKKYPVAIQKQPSFMCHYELDRRGDFLIRTDDGTRIHIEAKQLGDAQSHVDKLSHCFMNLISGCYGSHFMLVYDYNKRGTKGTLKKIQRVQNRAKVIKEQVALQGITFELVLIDELEHHMKKYNVKRISDE
tara:strand:+ start:1189 stop:1707 length:519 start_codon:yes stop_codon:yes gene_type:complete